MARCNQQATTNDTAYQAAAREGMQVFNVYLHVGGSTGEWLARSWEEEGYSVNAEGEPVSDHRGNTVARFTVREIDPVEDQAIVNDWYYGN